MKHGKRNLHRVTVSSPGLCFSESLQEPFLGSWGGSTGRNESLEAGLTTGGASGRIMDGPDAGYPGGIG